MSQVFRDDSQKYHDNSFHLQKRLVWIRGEINEDTATEFIANMNLLDEGPGGKKKEAITIDIYTTGGCSISAWAIYDRIRQSACFITGRVWGEASSAGAYILQACDERLISEHGALMLHEGEDGLTTNHKRNVESYAKQIPVYRGFQIEAFSRALCKSKRSVETLLQFDKYYYADEALEEGLVDRILENSEPEWYTDAYIKRIEHNQKKIARRKKK